MGTEQNGRANDSIRSAFWEDEDMRELVEFFVVELGSRVEDLSRAWEQANTEQLKVFAHQLKGAAPGYGFEGIGTAAGRLEASLSSLDSPHDLSASERAFRELLDLCRRAAADTTER